MFCLRALNLMPLDSALVLGVIKKAQKVSGAMKDKAIVLTASFVRLLPPGTNATNWHAWKPHTFTKQ